jgi:hypothetical protein
MDEIQVRPEYNLYPDIITFDQKNPTLRSPYSPVDLPFYQTRETLMDVDTFRAFVKNAESSFRNSREYKMYKSYVIEYLGINRCQIFGNVTVDDASIELHHNVINLFDICILITSHVINTVGYITTYDLITMLIQEHFQNNVGVVFLSTTAHQLYHHVEDGYLPPSMTFGKWWELLSKYRYGITYDLANKVVKYIKKYQDNLPPSVNPQLNEVVIGYANYNEYTNIGPTEVGYLPDMTEFIDGYYNDNEKGIGAYNEYGF